MYLTGSFACPSNKQGGKSIEQTMNRKRKNFVASRIRCAGESVRLYRLQRG